MRPALIDYLTEKTCPVVSHRACFHDTTFVLLYGR